MRRADFETAAEAFRARLAAVLAAPSDEQEWPTAAEWVHMPVEFTCPNAACRNHGRSWRHEPGLPVNADGSWHAVCALCGGPLDGTAVFDDGKPPVADVWVVARGR